MRTPNPVTRTRVIAEAMGAMLCILRGDIFSPDDRKREEMLHGFI